MKNYSLKTFVSVAVLSTIGFLLMVIEFPILPSAPFLKLDFSDIAALVGAFMFGPLAAILIELLKNVLWFMFSGGIAGVPIGEFANFLSGLSFVFPIYYLFRYYQSKRVLAISSGLATISITVVMCLFNYFILLPFYIKIGGLPKNVDITALITYSIIPFNLLKGVIVSVIFFILYNYLEPWILRNRSPKEKSKRAYKHKK
ncbi:Riboflavin ECF transporter S component FmnP [Listeria grayi]|uniref:Riboflavin transporter n=2 Tax=Listeria grayi TaxID=1641 RepID=D7UXW7_LISGR|nr:ECF transporter S component [Listeria grayi]EFI84525.1 hypothetical protein HMPREF0556_11078 [Listeria grayi DSM 20601]EUJ27149.1 Riboflavin transporter FmnP [Listeria grayi FSL F6-1183]VEI32761.1 Riboflavin ECF transporter S component FmnP [Listeria grayi]